jgi:hypothetical protein
MEEKEERPAGFTDGQKSSTLSMGWQVNQSADGQPENRSLDEGSDGD